MAYTKGYPLWKDDPDHTTPIVASKLNNFEDGIANAHGLIATLDGESDAALAAEQAARAAGDAAVQANLNAHLVDGVNAHEAESISVGPTNPVGADDVDEALRDLYAAIVGGGMPTTIIDAKGDLIIGADDDLPTRLPVGLDGEILMADSAEPFGLKYAPAPSGIPDTTGQEGEYLRVDVGGEPVWEELDIPDALPDMTGQEGNWLQVEGGVAVWNPMESGGGVDYKGAYAPATAYAQGDVVLYQGREYVCVNPGTGQTPPVTQPPVGALPVLAMATTLPASPYDGQQAILVDSLTAPTYSWLFRYVAAKASNKWVFLGGTSLRSQVATAEARAATAYGALATAQAITIPVAGDYEITCGFSITTSGGTQASGAMSYQVGGTAASDVWAAIAMTQVASISKQGASERSQFWAALAAGTVVTGLFRSPQAADTITYAGRILKAIPVAVGG